MQPGTIHSLLYGLGQRLTGNQSRAQWLHSQALDSTVGTLAQATVASATADEKALAMQLDWCQCDCIVRLVYTSSHLWSLTVNLLPS